MNETIRISIVISSFALKISQKFFIIDGAVNFWNDINDDLNLKID